MFGCCKERVTSSSMSFKHGAALEITKSSYMNNSVSFVCGFVLNNFKLIYSWPYNFNENKLVNTQNNQNYIIGIYL